MTPGQAACARSTAIHRAFSDRARERVAAHLQTCGCCAAEWEALDALAAAAKGSQRVALSPKAKDEIRARLLVGARAIAREPPPRVWSPRRVGFAAVLGLAAAAAVAVAVRSTDVARNSEAAVVTPVFRASIHARPGARFVVASAQPDEVVRLHDGTISVDVAPLASGERFRVITGDAEVEVHGTVFEVRAEAGRLARVSVTRGRVEVRAPGATPHLVAPGERWSPAPAPALDTARTEAAPTAGGDEPARASESGPLRPERRRDARVALPRDAKSMPTSTAPAPPASRSPSPSASEIAFQEGWAALRGGDASAAVRSFGAVPRDAPLGPDAAFWHGIALARAGRSEDAVRALTAFASRFPASPHRGEALAALTALRSTCCTSSGVETSRSK